MSILDNFELLETVSGVPSMSITKNGISFNKSTLEKMNKAPYVQSYIDKVEKRFAIKECEQNDKGAREFYKKDRDASFGARWNNYDLRTTIAKMMGWDLEEKGWKVSGEYVDDDDVLLFDLELAQPISSRISKKESGDAYASA